MSRDYPELRHVKSCCAFSVPTSLPSDTGANDRASRREMSIQLLGQVASGLDTAGYRITKVKPAIGIEAAFSCRLNPFLDVDVLLAISRGRDRLVDCLLLTRALRPMLSVFSLRKRPSESEHAEQFQALLHVIDGVLGRCLGATSMIWFTEHEANNLPESGPENVRSK